MTATADGIPPAAARRAAISGRILVADDSPATRVVMRAMLAKQGHEVTVVEHGGLAVEALRAAPFDLAVLDLQMPVMDGTDAARAVRAMEGPVATIPLVGLSADAEPGTRARCLGCGLDEYLTKPVDWALLADTVDRLLTERRGGAGARTPGAVAPAVHAAPAAVLDDFAVRQLEAILGREVTHGLLRGVPGSAFAELERLRRAQAAGDRAQWRAAAHRLKGMAGTHGCEAVRRAAERAEDAATPAALGPLLEALEDAIAATEAAIEALTSP